MPKNRYKRTDLFLLRVWYDYGNGEDRVDGGAGLQWHGRVQRPVSGEAHNFEGKEALIQVLEAMLYEGQKGRPNHSRPSKKAHPEADSQGTNNATVTSQ